MKQGTTYKKYDGEIKRKVLADIQENHLSYAEAERKYGVSKSLIPYWERISKERGAEALDADLRRVSHAARGRQAQLETPDDASRQELLLENERLRAEVDYLKNLNALVSERVQQERKRK